MKKFWLLSSVFLPFEEETCLPVLRNYKYLHSLHAIKWQKTRCTWTSFRMQKVVCGSLDKLKSEVRESERTCQPHVPAECGLRLTDWGCWFCVPIAQHCPTEPGPLRIWQEAEWEGGLSLKPETPPLQSPSTDQLNLALPFGPTLLFLLYNFMAFDL